jgi:hypothetical protein
LAALVGELHFLESSNVLNTYPIARQPKSSRAITAYPQPGSPGTFCVAVLAVVRVVVWVLVTVYGGAVVVAVVVTVPVTVMGGPVMVEVVVVVNVWVVVEVDKISNEVRMVVVLTTVDVELVIVTAYWV